MAVKVMITDDHSLIREGLKQLLELEGDFQVIAEACDGIDCMENLRRRMARNAWKHLNSMEQVFPLYCWISICRA